MSIYKQAIEAKLRFALIGKGLLSTEDLFDLTLPMLDILAKSLKKEKEGTEESFIKKTTSTNKEVSLKFEIVLDVIKTKMEKEEARKKAADLRARKAIIMEAIEEQEGKELRSKSVGDLKKELLKLEEEEVA